MEIVGGIRSVLGFWCLGFRLCIHGFAKLETSLHSERFPWSAFAGAHLVNNNLNFIGSDVLTYVPTTSKPVKKRTLRIRTTYKITTEHGKSDRRWKVKVRTASQESICKFLDT